MCVEEHRFSAATFSVSKNQVEIIGTGESEFSEDTSGIEAADTAISTAEKDLGENILIEKVIFGLPITFLEQEKIKSEYLLRLKKISKELSLMPCGFIEHPQALSFYLEKTEESPPTLILVSIGKVHLTFSFVRVGKIESNFVIKKTASFISDFEKGLTYFKSEILPSRIILYDGIRNRQQIEMLREELLSLPWHKHSSFLHTPKIEILPQSTLLTALVETASGSIIKELHLGEKQEETKPKEKKSEEIKLDADKKVEIFGFVKGKDINIEKEEHKKEKVVEEPDIELPKDLSQKRLGNKIAKLLSRFNVINIFFSLPTFSVPFSPIFALLITFAISITSLISLFWFYPRATVNLIVYPLVSSKQIEVTFTTDPDKKKEGQAGESIIPAKIVSEEAMGEKTLAVTGKKNIGEAARGEVTLYNKTLESKTFPKGTILTSSNFKFTLDDEVNVASASDTGEGLTFGKATAKITAVTIGPEGNLPSGTNFTFKDFPQSSYYAKNRESLTGGTSREVASVSKIDYDHLLLALSDELTSKAKQKLAQKITPPEKLIDGSLEKKVISKKFSKEIGEEAKEVNLSLTLQVSSLVFKETDLIELAKDSFPTPPSGFTLSLPKTQVKIDTVQIDKNGEILAKATISAYFYPEIDREKIKSEIAGKSYPDAAEHLSTMEHIGGIKIVRETALPFIKDKLPWNSQNINMLVSSQ